MNFLYVLTILFSVSFTPRMHSMDQKKLIDGLTQKHTVLHLSDGTDFSIETWKLTQSIVLYKDYLRREKNYPHAKDIPSLSCNVDRPEMELYRTACDIQPGQLFNGFFKQLTQAEQRLLINVCGKYGDSKQQRKLNAPALVAQLFQSYLLAAGFDGRTALSLININLRDRLHTSPCIGYCSQYYVNRNIPYVFLDRLKGQEMNLMANSKGQLQRVPVILEDGRCDGPIVGALQKQGDQLFMTYRIKSSEQYTYSITCATPENDEEKKENQCILWLKNVHKEIEKSIFIKHPDEINNFIFTQSSDYLCTVSNQMICLWQIVPTQDDFSLINIFTESTSDDECVMSPCFNKQSTALVASFFDTVSFAGKLVMWDLSGGKNMFVIDKNCGFVSHIEFNSSGTKVIISSLDHAANEYNLCIRDIAQSSTMVSNCKFDVKRSGQIDRILSAPQDNSWAIVFRGGYKVQFVYEKDDAMEITPPIDNLFYIACNERAIVHAQYSNDGLFLALNHPRETNAKRFITIYSAITHAWMHTLVSPGNALGFTVDGNRLIVFNDVSSSSSACTKIDLFTSKDRCDLNYLKSETSLLALRTMIRLWRAYQNNDGVILYNEEPSYKALQSLPNGLGGFMYKCFPTAQVITNAKDVTQLFHDVSNRVDNWFEDTAHSVREWWRTS